MTTKTQSTSSPSTKAVATQADVKPSIKKKAINTATKKSMQSELKKTNGNITNDTTNGNEEKKHGKKKKHPKLKVIRDSFSFPEQDYLKISALKQLCLSEGIHVKKGELLRAGLHLLTKLDLAELKEVIEQVEKVKTGRPNIVKH